MLTVIYQGILLLVILLIGWNLFSQKKAVNQINCALVLIPLVLRLFMMK